MHGKDKFKWHDWRYYEVEYDNDKRKEEVGAAVLKLLFIIINRFI